MYYAPRYWGVWLLFGLMRLLVILPISWQLAIGRGIGRFSYYLAPYRRKVTLTNFELCFPELNNTERVCLVKQNFANVAMGMVEIAMAWWLSEKRTENLATWYGCEHFDAALASGRPIIIAGAHFTCLEISARLFAKRYAYQLMHRPHKNALFNAMMTAKRANITTNVINRDDMRGMIKSIKHKIPVWYAPDQDYGKKYSVFAPFFGIQAASITMMSRLAKHTDAIVVPLVYHRKQNGIGYEFRFSPPFENYPSDDLVADATQYNQFLENDLRQHPEQYLWQHRRFKTRPEGEPKLYPGKRRRRRKTLSISSP